MVAIIFQKIYVTRILGSLSVRNIFYLAALLPFSALVLVFIVGAYFHYPYLFDYEWTCGKAYLPSISRVINMPVERVIFQLFCLFDVPFRLFTTWYHAHLVQKEKESFLEKSLRTAMCISSFTEIIFLALLATVGERESGLSHVVFFCIFTISSFTYFLTHSACLRMISDGTVRFEGGFFGRIGSVFTLTLTVPLIFVFFTLYNGFCVSHTYELFAIFEYVTVTAVCCYHATSYYQMTGQLFFLYPKCHFKRIRL